MKRAIFTDFSEVDPASPASLRTRSTTKFGWFEKFLFDRVGYSCTSDDHKR